MNGTDHIVLEVHDTTPAPQGSKSAVVRGGHAVLIEGSSNKARVGLKAWRDAVYSAALPHRRPEVDKPRPVEVSVGFRMPLPASKPRWRAGTDCEVKPDVDKLVRATLDALADAKVLVGGDSRVVSIEASKRYVAPGETPGADIDVWILPVPTRQDAA